MSSLARLLVLSSLALGSATATTVVIDDHFDDGTVTGWTSMGNGRTFSAHNISESGTTLTSEIIETQSDTHRGVISDSSFDPSSEAGGFSMTFVVSSQGTAAPGANGFFLGTTTATAGFFRNLDNFGLTFFGHATRTNSVNGVSLIVGDNNGGAAADFILDAQPGTITLAALQDGFTATIGADPTGWSYSIAGVDSALSGSGTWAAAGTDFATVFGGDTSWHALGSNQGPGGTPQSHTVAYDQITVTTIPEPSSALLLMSAIALIGRRRR